MVRREARWARIRAERMSQSQSQSNVECRATRHTSHVTRHTLRAMRHRASSTSGASRIQLPAARPAIGRQDARRPTSGARHATHGAARPWPQHRVHGASAAAPAHATHRRPARAARIAYPPAQRVARRSAAPARRKPARRPRDAGAARAHGAGRCARVGKTLNLRSSGRSPMCRTTNASSLRSARRS